MWHSLRENLLLPVLGRVGTAAAMWLVSKGWPVEYLAQLETVALVTLMLGADWLYAWTRRQTIIKTTAFEITKGVRSVTGAKVRPQKTEG